MPTPQIIVASQNMAYSGLHDAKGTIQPGRFTALLETVRDHSRDPATGQRPDVLLVQEVRAWARRRTDHRGRTRWAARAQKILGMHMVGICTSTTGGVAVLINPQTVGVVTRPRTWRDVLRRKRGGWDTRFTHHFHQGVGLAALRLPGLAQPVPVTSAHLNPYAAEAAVIEAKLLASRAHRLDGRLGITGGDVNYIPLDDGAIPDPSTIPPYNRSSRWRFNDQGEVVPNRAVAQAFALAGMVDVAPLIAERTHNPDLLCATGKGRCRVDQFWVTQHLAPAVVSYRVHHHPHSDHSLISMTLDPSRLDIDPNLTWV